MVEQRLDAEFVTADFRNETPSEMLHVIARRLGCEVTRIGSLYYLGTLKREDRGVLVRRVRRLSSDELHECVRVLTSDQGATATFSDGLCVIGDRVDVLSRIDELLNQVEQADSATWVVQLYLVSLEAAAIRDLGFDVRPTVEVAATFAAASGGAAGAPAAALTGGLNAVLAAAASNSNAHLVAEPLFLLVDGGDSEFVRGERVPVPRRVVSDQGTVTTEGFEMIQTGLTCRVSLRELRADAAKMTLDLSMSDITRFVESAPVTREDAYRTQAEIRSGGVYLLGSLVRQADSDKQLGGLLTQYGQQRTDTVMQVWGRAYRVGSPAELVSSERIHCDETRGPGADDALLGGGSLPDYGDSALRGPGVIGVPSRGPGVGEHENGEGD